MLLQAECEKIKKAVTSIEDGDTNRVEIRNIIVYKVGTTIRIDIKNALPAPDPQE